MALHRLRTAPLASSAVVLTSLITVAVLTGACTKMPLVAPSGTVITLISTTNVLAINGSADIIAVLVENGTTSTGTGTGGTTASTPSTGTAVHNGTLVSFSTTLGHIEPAEAKTSGGQVTVKLVADGRSGVATVTAYSGGASKTLTVNVGSAAAARLLVTASPQALGASGGTTTITASVQDQHGNPIQGVQVAFSTTAGSLGTTGAVTDGYGNAAVSLTTTAAATVTASAGGGTSGTLTGTVGITVQPRGTVSLVGPTGTVTVTVPVTFTVGVGATVAASDVVVNYGDGTTPRSLGAITSQVISHAYNSPGTYVATATATFVDGTSSSVSTDVVVLDFTVSAACGGNVTLGSTSTLTATVTPSTVAITNYLWTFFEGDPPETRTGNPLQYNWQSRGTKVVRLRVVASSGSSKETSCSLEVN